MESIEDACAFLSAAWAITLPERLIAVARREGVTHREGAMLSETTI